MLTISGCGNLNRCDDGVGIVVAYARRRGFDNVRLFDAGTGGMEVMFQARGAEQPVLVDASRSGAEPGAILLRGAAAGGSLLKVRNARGDRVVHALEFLRTLGIDADTPELDVPVRWAADVAGLVLEGVAAGG